MLAWYFLLLALLCSANLEKEHVDVVLGLGAEPMVFDGEYVNIALRLKVVYR